jgi:hypothetical protein
MEQYVRMLVRCFIIYGYMGKTGGMGYRLLGILILKYLISDLSSSPERGVVRVCPQKVCKKVNGPLEYFLLFIFHVNFYFIPCEFHLQNVLRPQ